MTEFFSVRIDNVDADTMRRIREIQALIEQSNSFTRRPLQADVLRRCLEIGAAVALTEQRSKLDDKWIRKGP